MDCTGAGKISDRQRPRDEKCLTIVTALAGMLCCRSRRPTRTTCPLLRRRSYRSRRRSKSSGSTSLWQVDNTYSVNGASGPELRYSGAAVTEGQFGAWKPIGAEQAGSGYLVALAVRHRRPVTMWNVDGGGQLRPRPYDRRWCRGLMQARGVGDDVPAGSQWRRYDGHRHDGDRSGGVDDAGPGRRHLHLERRDAEGLRSGGDRRAVRRLEADRRGAAGGGYQVAWQFGTADQYTIWNVDGAGSYVPGRTITSGKTYAFEAAETTFQQDLNGDGRSGLVTTMNRERRVEYRRRWLRSRTPSP